jgi:multidrug efflux pump subunit AcrB
VFLADLRIKRPVFATVLILAVVVLGLFSYRDLGTTRLPRLVPTPARVWAWVAQGYARLANTRDRAL